MLLVYKPNTHAIRVGSTLGGLYNIMHAWNKEMDNRKRKIVWRLAGDVVRRWPGRGRGIIYAKRDEELVRGERVQVYNIIQFNMQFTVRLHMTSTTYKGIHNF